MPRICYAGRHTVNDLRVRWPVMLRGVYTVAALEARHRVDWVVVSIRLCARRRKGFWASEMDVDTQCEDVSRFRAVTGVIMVVVTGLFLSYVYGYPRLFPGVELSQPDQFEAAVAKAMAAGRLDRALKIARRATDERPFDPMAFTACGRVLLAQGDVDKAVEQLGKAVAIVENAPGEKIRETRKPFYFAPARLTWGKVCADQGRLAEAVYHFDLARGDADLADSAYSEFSTVLREAYARQGFWGRSLEFDEPNDSELAGLDAEATARLARVAEGRQDWPLVTKLAERLLREEGLAGEAHYLLGRSCLGQQHYEAAVGHFEQAASKGHPGSAFYLGVAHENNARVAQALDAFMSVPASDLYRPLALGRAYALVEHLPENAPERGAASNAQLLDLLDQALSAMVSTQRPVAHDPQCRLAPIATAYSEVYFGSGGRFPLLLLREDARAASDAAFSCSGDARNALVLRRGNRVLQFEWVESQVDWDGVRHLPDGTGTVAGWIDTAQEWFGLRPDSVARVVRDGEKGDALSVDKLTWYYSVPFVPRSGAGYLLVGRIQGESGAGSLCWQAFDRRERVDAEGSTESPSREDSAWHACYVQAQPQWMRMRVQLATVPNAGSVLFRDVMMVAVDEPELPKK